MTGLKIKDGHCIRTPRHQTFVLKVPAHFLDPDGFPECLGDFLLARPFGRQVYHSIGGMSGGD